MQISYIAVREVEVVVGCIVEIDQREDSFMLPFNHAMKT